MKVAFNFCKLEDNKIKITDTSEYLSSDDFTFQEYKSEDIYCIDVLEKHDIEKDSTYINNIIKAFESSEFSLDLDGWYTLHHIILPSKDYFDKLYEDGTVIYQYNGFYYTDGEKFYKFIDNESSEVELIEIVTRNTLNTSILSNCVDYFALNNLNECYIKIVKMILDGNIKCETPQIKELTFNRDLIWMSINAIKYYVDLNQLEKALILLNKLEVCNGICKNLNYYDNANKSRCNCH